MTIPTIRIGHSNANDFRYIESGSGETYRCYGIALNYKAAKKLAAEIRKELRLKNVSNKYKTKI